MAFCNVRLTIWTDITTDLLFNSDISQADIVNPLLFSVAHLIESLNSYN